MHCHRRSHPRPSSPRSAVCAVIVVGHGSSCRGDVVLGDIGGGGRCCRSVHVANCKLLVSTN